MSFLKRAWIWFDDRSGVSTYIKPIAELPVPRGSGWSDIFGSATLCAFILQIITGTALATTYVTSAESAYDSLRFITGAATFGYLLRGMHFYGASAMMLMIGLHAIQTFLSGSFKFPRELNWLTGVVLLGVTLAMAFTGQLLRWDNNGIWTVFTFAAHAARVPIAGPQIARFILAGDTVGGATLSRFFAFHVFFIPGLIFAFLALHLVLVLRHGIAEPPRAGRPVDPQTYRPWYRAYLKEHGVPYWPEGAFRDLAVAVVVIAEVVLLAWLLGPPELGSPPDPTIVGADPRPDWYFLWIFSVVALLPKGFESFVIVGGPLLIGIILVLIPFISNRGERSPRRRPWAVGSVAVLVVAIGVLILLGQRASWSPDFAAQPLRQVLVDSTNPQLQQGALLFYNQGCQYCHAIQGEGGQSGSDLSNAGSRLTADQLSDAILKGRRNMPGYTGKITPEELDNLIAFLQSRK